MFIEQENEIDELKSQINELQRSIQAKRTQIEADYKEISELADRVHYLKLQKRKGEAVRLKHRECSLAVLSQFNDVPGRLMEVDEIGAVVDWHGHHWVVPISKLAPAF